MLRKWRAKNMHKNAKKDNSTQKMNEKGKIERKKKTDKEEK